MCVCVCVHARTSGLLVLVCLLELKVRCYCFCLYTTSFSSFSELVPAQVETPVLAEELHRVVLSLMSLGDWCPGEDLPS